MFSTDVWTNELDAKFIPIQILSGFTSGMAVRLVDKISKIYCFSKWVLEIFHMAGVFCAICLFKFILNLFNWNIISALQNYTKNINLLTYYHYIIINIDTYVLRVRNERIWNICKLLNFCPLISFTIIFLFFLFQYKSHKTKFLCRYRRIHYTDYDVFLNNRINILEHKKLTFFSVSN